MAGYVKRIALIKTLKPGYSADGGALKGIVRCEAYAGLFKAEASLINFAPLAEGAYRIGISDGVGAVIFDPPSYEGECSFDLSGGFACLVAFCRAGSVLPIASAVCGENERHLSSIQSAMESEEQPHIAAYDDEAIADENYYELETDKDGGFVRPDEAEVQGADADKDEESAGAGEGAPCGGQSDAAVEEGKVKLSTSAFRIGGSPEEQRDGTNSAPPADGQGEDVAARPELAGHDFFGRMSADIKNIFSTYPRLTALEDVIEDSKWAKITYGSGAHYAFGIIYAGGNAKYLCYAVPVAAGAPCPQSLKNRAGYVPVEGGGYWVMYQDARTGVSVKPC